MTTAQTIKKELKENGIKEVSVRDNHGHVNIEIKSNKIDIEKVEEIAGKYESYQRDEATQEILCGGNTFVFVTYSDSIYNKEEARNLVGKLMRNYKVYCAVDVVDWVQRLDSFIGISLPVRAVKKMMINYINQNWNVVNYYAKELSLNK